MKRIIFKTTAIVLVLAGVIACKKEKGEDDSNYITATGTVMLIPPPHACVDYSICIASKNYIPDHLPDEFKSHNLPVQVTYILTDKVEGCGFSGNMQIINLIKIVKL
jgi:hypothetical protein